MKETHRRSLIKGIIWRFIASGTTMGVVLIVTGNIGLVATVGFLDFFIKVFFYYLHERAWGKVKWGIIGTEPTFGSVSNKK